MGIELGRPSSNMTPVVLRPGDWGAAVNFCVQAGADGVLAGARIGEAWWNDTKAGEVWVIADEIRQRWRPHYSVKALCWFGANMILVGCGPEEAAVFGRLAKFRVKTAQSIVGQVEAVQAMWGELSSTWPEPRDMRLDQPLMEISTPPRVSPDRRVHPATTRDLDVVLPAAVAMFTEELGFPPPGADGSYRLHVAQLISKQRVFARFEQTAASFEQKVWPIRPGGPVGPGKKVVFKADLGAVMARDAQVHGVWTDPAWRGRGLAKHGMAAVVQAAQAAGIERVSLYVNGFNAPALAAYRAVGFSQVGTWATIMF